MSPSLSHGRDESSIFDKYIFNTIVIQASVRYLFFALLMILSINQVRAGVVTVYVYNTEFSVNPPGEPITAAIITQGDSIRWTWVQGGHTTTSVIGSTEQWNHNINSDSTEYTHQFNAVGVFWYYCIPHGSDNGDGTASGMASTITVLPAGSGACCLPNGLCSTTTESGCLSQDGSFSGIGSLCDTMTCSASIAMEPIRDNILYESETGALSNGLGIQLYAGNNSNGRRRPVIAFDLSEIPDGAEVQNAELTLYCGSATGDTVAVAMHRLFQAWGEGTSDASGTEADGAPSTTNDATWIHTFYNDTFWTEEGGDFDSLPSSVTDVSESGVYYTWSSEQMNEDVQHWLQMPEENHGWLLRGDENSTANTKRFPSRQNNNVDRRPLLSIDYVVPPTGACCLPDGTCATRSEMQCLTDDGTYQGNGTHCEDASCSVTLTPFVDALPLPALAVPETGTSGGTAHYRIRMTEQFQQLHQDLPPTRVWGYNGTYPGPTIEAFRDSLVTVQWINDLRENETGELRTSHVLTIDTCLHGPNETGLSPVAVVHLHGGKVPTGSDGYPEDAFPPGDSSGIYYYPNIQPAGTLWYHDHALGITRLNVMMGMAGLYVIRDENELSLDLPSGPYEIPLVIQDRSFNADGTMQYPESWHEHFFGNTILVNGKVWPYLNVAQGKYRFRVLNGSNSRTYALRLSDSSSFTQIGSELGLLETPLTLDSLVLLPGERYDIIIDFSAYEAGTEILLLNSAPAPYPGFSGTGVIPNVMKFIVQDSPGDTMTIPATLAEIEELVDTNAYQERIFELMTMPSDPCNGHVHQMWTIDGLMWDDITEFPVYGSTEIWTWHNASGVSHPMHMHLVSFQVLHRQAINESTGEPEGPILDPSPQEKGWKDTAHSPPGFRTSVIARFDGFTGLYPYHCHILEHEDHEMMRQFEVISCLEVRTVADDDPGSLRYAIDCAQNGDTVVFDISLMNDTIILDDVLEISKNITILNANAGTVYIDGRGTSRTLTVNGSVELIGLGLISGPAGSGRAIINNGNLVLDNVTVYDSAIDPMSGNAVLNHGVLLTQHNCSILILEE